MTETLWLRVRAPFAAYRLFQAGVYRSISPVVPPSAAFGLVLNLAGIEMRSPVPGPVTLIREGLPCLRLAIGAIQDGEVSTLYQQLHTYPVGNSGQDLAEQTHGAKYWITPARRELLTGLDAVIGVQTAEAELLERVRSGLRGELDVPRYGLPFAGDNNFLFDRIDILDVPLPARWYVRMEPDDPPRRGSCRLSVRIDRADNSKTVNILYAPTVERLPLPPEGAWTWTPTAPDTVER